MSERSQLFELQQMQLMESKAATSKERLWCSCTSLSMWKISSLRDGGCKTVTHYFFHELEQLPMLIIIGNIFSNQEWKNYTELPLSTRALFHVYLSISSIGDWRRSGIWVQPGVDKRICETFGCFQMFSLIVSRAITVWSHNVVWTTVHQKLPIVQCMTQCFEKWHMLHVVKFGCHSSGVIHEWHLLTKANIHSLI